MMGERDNDEKLAKEGDDNGHLFGNFAQYYQFHAPHERIGMMTREALLGEGDDVPLIADIGCNSGDLTAELFELLAPCSMIGVDLDQELIDRASLAFPSSIRFACADICHPEGAQILRDTLLEHGRQRFSIISLFSITMWIHINQGDDGLLDALRLVMDLSDRVLIEPQPWKCYKTARARCRRRRLQKPPHLETIKLRQDLLLPAINALFLENGFHACPIGTTTWERTITLYSRL